MKTLVLVAGIFAASPVSAEPNQLSQHPRVGELAQIEFANNSDRLSVDYNKKLGYVAGWLQENPTGLIVVDGFARPGEKGSDPATVVLSLRRAEAVRDELVSEGVDADRVVIAAFGGRGASRAVVWGTREPRDLAISRLEKAKAATVLWGTQRRTAVAGR
jgi:outer membrane protein OmpA-like peptidoglycan-associated protein